jgi:hypothetical protein
LLCSIVWKAALDDRYRRNVVIIHPPYATSFSNYREVVSWQVNIGETIYRASPASGVSLLWRKRVQCTTEKCDEEEKWKKRDTLPGVVLEHYLNPYHILSIEAVAINGKGVIEIAELLYLRVLSTEEQVLGTNHFTIATTLNNLGLLYQEQSKYSLEE